MAGDFDSDSDRHVTVPSYAHLARTRGWAAHTLPGSDPSGAQAEAAADERYADGEVLGTGGMGKVLLARDARIGRDVALKQLHTLVEPTDEERARFLREAQVQGQLEHPSIVPVYDIDQWADGTPFFTMRRVRGKTLATIVEELRAGAPAAPSRRELLQAFTTVCLTVDYAHSRGVIHRDLKPANIMLGDFGEVYVLDWGLARMLDATPEALAASRGRLSEPGITLGTPLYMAPEQLGDPDVGPAADIFALGAILFELLTHERVRNPRALYAPVDAQLSTRAPHLALPPELETICVRATAYLPEDRYPTARALHDAVARYLDGDRELAQRRLLATTHADAARAALQRATDTTDDADHERERGAAMTELVRALALDPTNDTNVAAFAELLATPPRVIPPAVTDELEAANQGLIRIGSQYSGLALLSWFLFTPLVLALGVRRYDLVLAIAIPAAVAMALSFIAARQRPVVSPAIQYALIGAMVLGGVGLSRLFGPLILMPTLLTTWAIVLQAHPHEPLRRYGLVLAATSMIVPIGLELAGVLPSSYLFADGRMQLLPQMTDLPREPVLAFLVLTNVGMAVMPALFIARLRKDLSRVQTRQSVQTWHFRRVGEQLIGPG